MGVLDDLRAKANAGTPPAAPSPPVATSPPAVGEGVGSAPRSGGGVLDALRARAAAEAGNPSAEPQVTTQYGVSTGMGEWFTAPATGRDYTKVLEAEQTRLVQERLARGEKASEALMEETYAEAKRRVPQQTTDINTDPLGQGAAIRFKSQHLPSQLATEGNDYGIPNVAKVLPEPVQAWLGRNVSGPGYAFERGVQESMLLPGETVDGKPRQNDEGPLTYNESSGVWQLAQASRLAASTFLGTAAAAGRERARDAGEAPTPEWSANPLNWAPVELATRAWQGWGTPEHLRSLERGHDIVTLRHDLDLGRLATPLLIGPKVVEPVARAVGADTVADFVAKGASSDDMVAALGISFVDLDIFAVAPGAIRAGRGLLGEVVTGTGLGPAVSGARDAVKEAVTGRLMGIGIETPTGRAVHARMQQAAVQEAKAKAEVLQESMAGRTASTAPFDVMKEVEEITSSLPQGPNVMMAALSRAVLATKLEAEDATFKAVDAAQRAFDALLKHGGETAAAGKAAKQAADEASTLASDVKAATKPKAKEAYRAAKEAEEARVDPDAPARAAAEAEAHAKAQAARDAATAKAAADKANYDAAATKANAEATRLEAEAGKAGEVSAKAQDKYKKAKALAERGYKGEKAAAAARLKEMEEKYGPGVKGGPTGASAEAAKKARAEGRRSRAAAAAAEAELRAAEDAYKAAKDAATAARKAADDAYAASQAKRAKAEGTKAAKAAYDVSPDGTLPSYKEAKGLADVQTLGLKFAAARAAETASAAVVRNLEVNLAAMRRMAQTEGKGATEADVAVAKDGMAAAWGRLQAAKQEMLAGAGDVADMRAASTAYWKATNKAISAVGRRAITVVEEQLDLAREGLTKAGLEYKAVADELNKALPGEGDLRTNFEGLRAKHAALSKTQAKAFTASDVDNAVVAALRATLDEMDKSYTSLLKGASKEVSPENALALQSLATSRAMAHLGGTWYYKGAAAAVRIANEVFGGSSRKRVFGGTSELTAEAGKAALAKIQNLLEDMTRITGHHGTNAPSKYIDYMDTTETQVPGALSYNASRPTSLWSNAKPVLRAMMAMPNPPGQTIEAMVTLFYPKHKIVESGKEAELRDALRNLLNHGSRKPLAAKDTVEGAAKAVAEAAAKVAESAKKVAGTPEAVTKHANKVERHRKALAKLAEAEERIRRAGAMSLDEFALEWYHASLEIMNGDARLAAWVKNRPVLRSDVADWLIDLQREGMDPGLTDEVLANLPDLLTNPREAASARELFAKHPLPDGATLLDYLDSLPNGPRASLLLMVDTVLHAEVPDLPRWQRPKRTSLKDLLRPEAVDAAMEGGVTARDATAVADTLHKALAVGFAAVGEASVIGDVGKTLTADAIRTANVAENGAATPALLKALKAFDLNAYSSGGGEAANIAALMEALGMQTAERTLRTLEKDMTAGLQVFEDPMGEFFGFLPHNFIKSIDDKIGTVANSGEAFTGANLDASQASLKGFANWAIRKFQTSLLMGLWSPIQAAGYWNIQAFGAMTQAHAAEGAGLTGAALTAASDFAVLGQGIQRTALKARDRMAKRLGVPVDSVLPNFLSTMIDPRLSAIYDTQVGNAAQVLDGSRNITVGDMRRLIFDLRIASTFASTAGLTDVVARTRNMQALKRQGSTLWQRAKSSAGNAMTGQVRAAVDDASALSEGYADFMQAAESRRRVSLFTHLVLDQGYSPERAQKVVMEAFYDWDEPMTSIEERFLSQVFMFWSFQRRSLAVAGRALAAPFTDPTTGVLDAAVHNQPMWARAAGKAPGRFGLLGEQAKFQHAAQEQAREGDEDSDTYPWYVRLNNQYSPLTNSPMPDEWVDFEKARGLNNTHLAYMMPTQTGLGQADQLLKLAQLAAAWAMWSDGVGNEDLLRTIADFGGPGTEPAMTGVIDSIYGPSHPDFGANYVQVKNPADLALYYGLETAALPFRARTDTDDVVAGLVTEDAKFDTGFVRFDANGGAWVPRWVAGAKAVVPAFGTEWNRSFEGPIRAAYGTDIASADSVLQNMKLLLGSWSRLARAAVYNPMTTQATDIKQRTTEKKSELRENRLRPKGTMSELWKYPFGGDVGPGGGTEEGAFVPAGPTYRPRLKVPPPVK